MTEKRFVLGVGAQKAATTWLYHYMSAQESIDMGPVKEHSALTRRHRGPVDAVRKLRHLRSREDFLRWRMRGSLSFYVDYFSARVTAPGVHTTGDITPRYALLDEGLLREIKARFARRGIRVRPIFVMRDPVDRCWSAFRMNLDDANDRTMRFRNRRMSFYDYCTEPGFQDFTTYHKTIDRLENVFPPEDIFIGFYETLFAPSGIADLSDWLGVPASREKTRKKQNASAPAQDIPPEERAAVAAHYRDVYAAIGARYPEIRSVWRGFSCLNDPQDMTIRRSDPGHA